MRILCWNVNGWKKIRTYQPWFRLDTWSAILEYLNADVICLQETKLTRKQALDERAMCLPGPSWESFWDFHPSRGYSGTVIYTNKDTVGLPELAEVGITGRKHAARSKFRSPSDGSPSKTEPSGRAIGGYPRDCQDELDDDIFRSLDEEGRCTIVDYGFFVLFNLYCPVMGSEDRKDFRQAFYACVDERARKLMDQGRNVIIVGDINIARQPIDHCDHCRDDLRDEELATYYNFSPTRSWFEGFCQPRGPFHDVARECFPQRQGMFTCWNTLINARPSNYGTRIDYTLVSPGLKEWVKHGDIQADVMGSDHCPVFVDLYDERVIDGKAVKLRDLLSNAKVAPPLAASRWPEFNTKSLKTFFAAATQGAAAPAPSSGRAIKDREIYQPPPRPTPARSEETPAAAASQPAPVTAPSTVRGSPQRSRSAIGLKTIAKRNAKAKAKAADAAAVKAAAQKSQGKQMKLGSFFTKSPTKDADATVSQAEALRANSPEGDGTDAGSASRPNTAKRKRDAEEEEEDRSGSEAGGSKQDHSGDGGGGGDDDVDWEYLASLPDPDAPSSSQGTAASNSNSDTTAEAWSTLFRPPPAPLCTTHREPAKSFVVNKRDKGANFGRKFWLCARPVGPGWEKGWHERGNGGEDLEYRCGFFMWNSAWEGELKRRGKGRGSA